MAALFLKQQKTKPTKHMKKIAMIAIAVTLTSVGVGFAMNSLGQIKEQGKCEHGTRCHFCKGSGWSGGSGNTKCIHCKGTGANSSY
jgi:DnaJ-class molecular chaperone